MASVRFRDLQVAAGRILSGLDHAVAPTGGMAGSDDAGRVFAERYDPAAQSVCSGLVRARKQLADAADRLLAMAWNCLQAEQGSNFRVPQVFGDVPERSRPADDPLIAVPSAAGAGEQSGRPLIGQFWPHGDPERLRPAAAAWGRVAELTEELSRRSTTIVAEMADANGGAAIDAFAESWTPLTTLLTEVATTSRKLNTACDFFARRIEDQRHTIEAVEEDVTRASQVAALAGADTAIDNCIRNLPVITPMPVPEGVALFRSGNQDVEAAGDPP